MLKVVFLVCGGLLVGSAVTVLYVWPNLGPAPPDPSKMLVMAMAEHLFKESRFPVLVRRDTVVSRCEDSGTEGGVVLLTQEGQQAVTEFVYNSGVVCIHTYLSRHQSVDGREPVVFNARSYEIILGELPKRAFYGDHSVGFRFPQNQDESVVAAALGNFLQRIPRYFNARTGGGLSNMVSEFRSPHAVAQLFVEKVSAQHPKDKPALNIPGGWFLILGVGLSTLAIPTVLPIVKRFRTSRVPLAAVTGSTPTLVPGTAATGVAGSAGPMSAVKDRAAARERFIAEREEQAIRMIDLLRESIAQEAGPYAAGLIFADGEAVAKKAEKRGAAPRTSERVFLAGKLAELLDRKRRSVRTDLAEDMVE